MSDKYIKREDAISKIAHANAYDLCAEYGQNFSCDKVDMDSEIENATKFLSDIPSADVAPIVRCKDCKWKADTIGESWCDFHEFTILSDDDFCSYGERRDNETD